jgi:transcriptional regulator with XRE-family HTH domain
MGQRDNFAKALRRARTARGMTQEDFSITSSRTYVSMLERGVRSPTLSKINELSEALGIHPLTLLALAYCGSATPEDVRKLFDEIQHEVLSLLESPRQIK